MKPVFPHAIDNSMRKLLVKCQKSAHYRFELGLLNKDSKRVDLIAGKAFAAGLEATRRAYFGERTDAASAAQRGVAALYASYGGFPCPRDSNKSAERMAGALLYYLQKYPLDGERLVPLAHDGKLAVEIFFSYPMGLTHPDDDTELQYCGNFDMLAVDLDDGGLWVVDEKTTSSMGEKWANQWPLDSQMTGYVWGAQRWLQEHGLTHEVKGAIINGVAIKKYDYDCGRFKTYREPWEVDRWFNQLQRDVGEWRYAYKHDAHNMNLDHSCAYYLNPCEFAPLCKSRNPQRQYEHGGQYVVEFWNPADRK